VTGPDSSANVVTVRDCSPFPELTRDQEIWLRKLVFETKTASMLLRLGRPTVDAEQDDDPLAVFDSASGRWLAGRYVGEVQFEGITLRMEPRFGMPALMRWLSTVWGVRLVDSKGTHQQQRIWLWLVIAHLWVGRLMAASKHGLPYRRVDTVHRGHALRGRLLAQRTALARKTGDDCLVSVTRNRVTDVEIGSILLAAFERLDRALKEYGKSRAWLPERACTLVEELSSALCGRDGRMRKGVRPTIRYSPITESYRPIVDLSLSILEHKPLLPTSAGDRKAFGIVLDVAEIWELYVAKVLQTALPAFRVNHTGRSRNHFRWLLRSSMTDDTFGTLRPDIIVSDVRDRCLAIVDAKYKTTRINTMNRTGVVTEDLYQLAAYLSAFGESDSRLDGFLVYPEDEMGQVVQRLAPRNPWALSAAPKRNLWFVSVNCGVGGNSTQSENRMASLVQSAIENCPRAVAM
jgi:5-methylcytosine-specific restriction enzyme subunit McrC